MSKPGVFHTAVFGMRWIAASKIMVQASTWLLTILSVRLLRPSDYGIVSMAGLITVFLNLVLEGGVGVSIVQKREHSREVLGSLVSALLSIATAVAAALCLAAGLFADFFSEPALRNVLRVASLQFPLTALIVVPSSLLVKDMRFKELAIAQTAAAVAQGVATVALAYAGFAYWALVYSSLLGLLVRFSLLAWYARPPFVLRCEWRRLGPYASSGRVLIGQRILWFFVEETDRFLVAKSSGTGSVGAYSVAKTLSHTFLDRLAEIVNQVSLPAFAAKQGDAAASNRGLVQLQSLAATVAFPVFWGLAAIAPTVLPLVLGPRWEGAVWPFSLFCLILPLRVWYSLIDTAVVAGGRNSLALGNVLIWVAVLVPMFAVAVSYGIVAVAAAWAIGFPIVYLIVSRRIAAAVGLRWVEMLQPTWGAALCAAPMAIMVIVIGRGLEHVLAPVSLIATQIAVGVITYCGAMWLVDRARLLQITHLGLRLLGKR